MYNAEALGCSVPSVARVPERHSTSRISQYTIYSLFLEAVYNVYISHTTQVQAIVFAKSVQIHDSGSNKVVPVCPSSVQELTSFISAASPAIDRSTPAAYVDAFTTAFNTLNNNTDTGTW